MFSLGFKSVKILLDLHYIQVTHVSLFTLATLVWHLTSFLYITSEFTLYDLSSEALDRQS